MTSWSRANRMAHANIMATLPDILHEECAQRVNAPALWAYLEQRFAEQALTSLASLVPNHRPLENFWSF